MSPQTTSNIRTVIKIVGTILATHGATKAAALVNSEDSIGLIMTACAWVWSHYSNSITGILDKADALTMQQILSSRKPPAKPPMADIGGAEN